MDRVKFAVPNGSLAKATFEMLRRSGYETSGEERSYRPTINDPRIELKILRPQEIPVFVNEGLQDIGITGLDWIKENKTEDEVEVLLNLEYGRVKIVAAVPETWTTINSLSDLLEKFLAKRKKIRISSEYLNITADYVMANRAYQKSFKKASPTIVTPWFKKGENPKVSVFLSFGATEAKLPEDADAIVDVSQTGETLKRNHLKAIETIAESTAVLIANKKSLNEPQKKEKIYDILHMLRGAVDARKKLHIFMNVKKQNLQKLLTQLPALKKPTISPLSAEGWYSINTVIEQDYFLELLPKLRKLAQGLVVYEPRQVLTLENGGM